MTVQIQCDRAEIWLFCLALSAKFAAIKVIHRQTGSLCQTVLCKFIGIGTVLFSLDDWMMFY